MLAPVGFVKKDQPQAARRVFNIWGYPRNNCQLPVSLEVLQNRLCSYSSSGTRQLQRQVDTWERSRRFTMSSTSQLHPPGQSAAPKPWKNGWLLVKQLARIFIRPCPPLIHRSQGRESEEWLDNLHNFRGNLLTNLITTEEQTRQSQQAQLTMF